MRPFHIPDSWTVNRSHDWGESKPFANLWWAESDGSEVFANGQYRKFPRGTLFLIGEWYGCPPGELNTGLNMSSSDVAKGVKWIDTRLAGKEAESPESIKQGQVNIIPGLCAGVSPGPADSSIFNTGDNELSIGEKMKRQGVTWKESDKRPGSRKNGASLFCDMLEAALNGKESESGNPEEPAFYVFEHCRGWISRIPILPRDPKDPDDVDTSAEDHDWDATRYRVLAKRAETSVSTLRI
jgi:hypothetical protein